MGIRKVLLSVIAVFVLVGSVANAQTIRDPMSRKTNPERGYFEPASKSASQPGILQKQKRVMPTESRTFPSFFRRLFR